MYVETRAAVAIFVCRHLLSQFSWIELTPCNVEIKEVICNPAFLSDNLIIATDSVNEL